ncbi:MAG: GntR family transcriptional regulator, partial [Candidatus Humimicrobiaceae bacterium]
QEKMAERLGISKIPLIQALSVLRNERLIEYHPRKGFFVRKISKQEYYDLIDVRRILECLAVQKIIDNLNEGIKKTLLKFLSDFEKYNEKKDYIKYYGVDKKFHIYLLEASGNSYLKHINNSFNILLLCFTKGFRTKIELSMDYHRKIINAILKKEIASSLKLMKVHIEHKKESHLLDEH